MTRKLYSSRLCKLHSDATGSFPAATCPFCHDEAEEQRDRQWAQQRREAHRAYLERRG